MTRFRLMALTVGILAALIGAGMAPAKNPAVSAYVHHVNVGTGGNLCASDLSGTSTVLNNSLANGNPNAIIVITSTGGNSSSAAGRIAPPGVLSVFYDDANSCGNGLNRWVLTNSQTWQPSPTPFTGAESFNVVVTAP